MQNSENPDHCMVLRIFGAAQKWKTLLPLRELCRRIISKILSSRRAERLVRRDVFNCCRQNKLASDRKRGGTGRSPPSVLFSSSLLDARVWRV